MARHKKVDTSQLTFDFEIYAAQSEELKQELEEDANVYLSGNLTAVNATGIENIQGNQLSGLEHSGTLGGQQPGEIGGYGQRLGWDDTSHNQASETAGDRNRHPDQLRGNTIATERADGPRGLGDARDTNGTVAVPAQDYIVTEADNLGAGGAITKFRQNIEALQTLKALQERQAAAATPDEQAILVKYTGWGGIPQAFDANNTSWREEVRTLRETLTPGEYDAARRSTQDAHYTSAEVINGIYRGLDRLGLDGPMKVLEPSAGIGHFLGLRPENWREKNKVTAIELDTVTAEIGRYLYPTATYLNAGFQDITIPDGYYDLAIGNPPFGAQHVYDSSRPYLDMSIHNYFLTKSVETLREGGVAAFVVSRYFMDAQDTAVRRMIAEKANLLGAIRLPNTVFKENAGTEVTTDIVFFQRTATPEVNPCWVETGLINDDIRVNRYYIDTPEQMIGTMAYTNNMFRNSADLIPHEAFAGFEAEISKRLNVLPVGIYQARSAMEPAKAVAVEADLETCRKVRVFSYFMLTDGQIGQRLADIIDKPDFVVYEPKNKAATERISGMIAIRDNLTALMTAEQNINASEQALNALRADLNRHYDAFIKAYGYISSQANHLAMREDPMYPLLTALERNYDPGISATVAQKTGKPARLPAAEKADILYRRVLGPKVEITHVETAQEALIVSMNEKGCPDLVYMESLTGKTADELQTELSGRIYLNPESKQWEIADRYLAGNVKQKLAIAGKAAEANPEYAENVEALLKVQPVDLEPVDIHVQFGSTWLPPRVMREFGESILGERAITELNYSPIIGQWSCEINTWAIDYTIRTDVFGTDKYDAGKIFQSLLDNTQIRVNKPNGTDANGKTIYVLDPEATAAAQQKGDEMRQVFRNWIWNDTERRTELTALYNERFNTNVPKRYNGEFLEMPGMSQAINLQAHQKDAIWRAVQDGTALFDHPVGSGKTMVCIGAMMRMRQLGLVKKPLINVPNHLLNQWKDAWYTMYPQANILVADKRDFTPENRAAFFAKVATGDWDAIIVAHSSFGRIGLPETEVQKLFEQQVNELVSAIEACKIEQGNTRGMVKLLEKERDRLMEKMERQYDAENKEVAVTFADLGVDAVCTDEAQEFKNLAIRTGMSRVAGLGNLAGSAKAAHLYTIEKYLQAKNNGKGVFRATGTPLSNSLAEMFNYMKSMAYDELQTKGLHYFDAWASTFGEVSNGWELDASGISYKSVQRFSSFKNLPELTNIYLTFADVISREQVIENNKVSLVPKLKGGKPQNIVASRSEEQANFMGLQIPVVDHDGQQVLDEDGFPAYEWTEGSIIYRMEHLPGDPKEDNPLVITTDAKKAGLDYRLINPTAPDYAGSKVNLCVEKIHAMWATWEADRGTQLVFCDMSTPKLKNKNQIEKIPELPAADGLTLTAGEIQDDYEFTLKGSDFSVYEDIKAKLIAKGIPEEEIKFIHEADTDAKKSKLFEDVNKGRVRILIGSTQKMGAGTNVQERLVALHHLDAPWRPSDLEQREGRILRQGNKLFARDPDTFEVEIYRYATELTYDARMWQTIENKAKGIEQFRNSDGFTRSLEDVTGSEAANAAEMKAAASGNELIFTQVQLQSELRKMESVYNNHERNQHLLESRIARLEKMPEITVRECERWNQEISLRDANTTTNPFFVIEGRIYGEANRKELLNEIGNALKMAERTVNVPVRIGNYRGFGVSVKRTATQRQFILAGKAGSYLPDTLSYGLQDSFSITGFLQRIDNFMSKFENFIKDSEIQKEKAAAELIVAKENLGKPFPQELLLKTLRQDNIEVIRELTLTRKNPKYKSAWQPMSMDGGKLKDVNLLKQALKAKEQNQAIER